MEKLAGRSVRHSNVVRLFLGLLLLMMTMMVASVVSNGPVSAQTGTITRIDVNGGDTNRTRPGWLALNGEPGESVTSNGVTYTLFGFQAGENRDRGLSSELLSDFAFNDGASAGIGVRISGLPAGLHFVNSWHYDGAPGISGKFQIEWRKAGTQGRVVVNQRSLAPGPVVYALEADGQSVYELVVREDDLANRARLNGLQFTFGSEPSGGTATSSCSGWCEIDRFDERLNGSVRQQGEWRTNQPGATDGAIVTDTPPPTFSGKALMNDPNGTNYRGNTYLPLGRASVPNGSTATFYFEVSTDSFVGSNLSIGLSDVAAPGLGSDDTGTSVQHSNFEAQLILDDRFRVRDGAFIDQITNFTPADGEAYAVWMVVDNSSDSYEVYVRQVGASGFGKQLSAGGQTRFSFRNGTAGNALITYLQLNAGQPTSKSYLDNLHMFLGRENIATTPFSRVRRVDSFDDLPDGAIGGAVGWTSSTASAVVSTDPTDAANKVLAIPQAETRLSRTIPSIANQSTGTLFFRMRRDGAVNASAGLSDVAAPSAFGDFEAQVNNQSDNLLRVRDGSTFDTVANFADQTWYCVWVVADNPADDYEVYVRGGEFARATRMQSGSQSMFDFRNGTGSALSRFFVRMAGVSGTFYLDDLYVLTSGEDLSKPAGNDCPTTGDPSSLPLADPIPETIEKGGLGIRVVEFAEFPVTGSGTRARLNYLDHANDGTDRLFVNDLRGNFYVVRNGTPSVYLDVRAQFPHFVDSPRLGTGFGFFAFHPEFASNGKFYTVHTEAGSALSADTPDYTSAASAQVHGIITEWTASNPASNTFSGTKRQLLRVGFRTYLHGMQQIGFNPTANPGDEDYGLLYISLGDGDENPNFTDGPQNLGRPHGKIFRIDPLGTNSPNGNYGIPAANPFVGQAGALGEIWAYGLRNPHRFSWDPGGTNKMFIGNIGEKNIDSIYPGLPGANYGWNEREGTFLFRKDNPNQVYTLPANDAQLGYTYPVAEYDHDEGFAVVGGFVYRGSDHPGLVGRYVFGDIPRGRIFHTAESDMIAGGSKAPIQELRVFTEAGVETSLTQIVQNPRFDTRFGTDADGELYILSKTAGKIWKVEQP